MGPDRPDDRCGPADVDVTEVGREACKALTCARASPPRSLTDGEIIVTRPWRDGSAWCLARKGRFPWLHSAAPASDACRGPMTQKRSSSLHPSAPSTLRGARQPRMNSARRLPRALTSRMHFRSVRGGALSLSLSFECRHPLRTTFASALRDAWASESRPRTGRPSADRADSIRPGSARCDPLCRPARRQTV
jgi:hypothetical protein